MRGGGVTADSYWRRQVTTAWKVTNRNLMGTNAETSPNLTEVKIKRKPKKRHNLPNVFAVPGTQMS